MAITAISDKMINNAGIPPSRFLFFYLPQSCFLPLSPNNLVRSSFPLKMLALHVSFVTSVYKKQDRKEMIADINQIHTDMILFIFLLLIGKKGQTSASYVSFFSFKVKPKITLYTTQALMMTEGDTRTLLCVASGNPGPSYTWYKNNVKVQEGPNNSNYTITSANRYQTGMYRCEAVVTTPTLGPYRADYNVSVTVRCK